jgi:hypothetical protein
MYTPHLHPYLQVLPCLHYWLAVHCDIGAGKSEQITAICKHCRRTQRFTNEEFEELGRDSQAKHAPERV